MHKNPDGSYADADICVFKNAVKDFLGICGSVIPKHRLSGVMECLESRFKCLFANRSQNMRYRQETEK